MKNVELAQLLRELAAIAENYASIANRRPGFDAAKYPLSLATRARAAAAGIEGSPPKNCWLDDEPGFCPSACVFDDPSEKISDCTYAKRIQAEGGKKENCYYYRPARFGGHNDD